MDCVLYEDTGTVEYYWNISAEEEALVGRLRAWNGLLWTRVMVILCCFGIIGNVLNLLVLTRRSLVANMGDMEKSATTGLVALALSDLLFCLLNLPNAAVNVEQEYWYNFSFILFYKTYGNALMNIFVVSSTWLTVVMAFSRYLAICHPLHARFIVDMKFAKASIIVVFAGSVLLNLPRFWHFRVLCTELSVEQQREYPTSSPRWYTQEDGRLGRGSAGWRAFIICYFIVAVLIPLMALAFCNVYLVRALHQSAKMRNQFTRREHRPSSSDATRVVTLTLTVIVIANIVLVAPCEIFTFVDQIVVKRITDLKSHTIYNLLVACFNVLQVLSFSFNFVLYIVINAHFRRAMKEVLSCHSMRPGSAFGDSAARYESVTTTTHVPLTGMASSQVNGNSNHDNKSKLDLPNNIASQPKSGDCSNVNEPKCGDCMNV